MVRPFASAVNYRQYVDESRLIRYGTIHGVPGTTSSRVDAITAGAPRHGMANQNCRGLLNPLQKLFGWTRAIVCRVVVGSADIRARQSRPADFTNVYGRK